ncbi:F-box protein At4g09920-like [Silene latifolia]|uniref:F-box protein At4g09920-like n=1 Tax=Silene latifolia TaxID=37657 RepID=UPI003D77B16D
MVVDGKKAAYGQLNYMDRLSDLPDSILHHIISFLGTKGACRTTILSKRWSHIWSTGLILEFRPRFFVPKKDGGSNRPYSEETVGRLINFIESTMRRYSEKNLSIRMFRLDYPTIDPNMTETIDRWVGIALQNQVEKLLLSVIPKASPSYLLPAFFFLAKSLISVRLSRVRVPYFENMKLISLQCLDMKKVDVDEKMLQNIIMSCPLKNLRLDRCSGLENISIPCCSRLESLDVIQSIPIGGELLVNTSSLQRCTYFGYHEENPWSIILTPASKKNLRDLRIFGVVIKDDIFSKLVSEIPSIEDLSFYCCTMPMKIKIVSQTLKQLGVYDCFGLINVVIDAPELETFCYDGGLRLSSVINSQSNYNAYLHLNIGYTANVNNRDLVRIKKLLKKFNCCKILSIILNDDAHHIPQIDVDMDQLSKIGNGLPCYVEELKLSLSCSTSTTMLGESTCRALIDGLLWCCRPDILSLRATFIFNNNVNQTVLEILQQKVKYWKHPLKRMEIEGATANGSPSSGHFDLRLKLYW